MTVKSTIREMKLTPWAAALLVLTGMALRAARIGVISMWSDEYHTISVVSHSLVEIVTIQYSELNPPLYFALLDLVLELFPDTEFTMRLLSLLFGTVSLVLFFWLARIVLPQPNRLASLAALALMAFHPYYVYYAVEIRAYALLLLLTLLSFIAYFRARQDNHRRLQWLIVLALSLTGVMYTHHFGILTVLTIGIFSTIEFLRPTGRAAGLRAVGALGGALLLYVPGAIFIFARQASNYSSDASNLVPPQIFLQVFSYNNYAPSYTAILTIFSLAALVLGFLILVRRNKMDVTGIGLGLAILAAIAATLIAYGAGVRLLPRYLLHIATLVFLIMAATVTTRGSGLLRTAALSIGGITVLLYAVYGIGFTLNVENEAATAHWKADWREISRQIEHERRDGEPVVTTSWDARPVQYYLGEKALTLIDLERQLGATPIPYDSYLLVITPHSNRLDLFEGAVPVYENKVEGIELRRLKVH